MLKRTIVLLVAAMLLVVGMSLSGCSKTAAEEPAQPTVEAEQPTQEAPVAEEPSATTEQPATQPVTKLKIEDVKKGTGAEATVGKTAVVHYTLWLTDGTKVESSKDSGQPFPFPVGGGQVIPGWDQGVPGMKVGGVRKLTIPPDLAYGAAGSPPAVPPNATLVFEIELVEVQ